MAPGSTTSVPTPGEFVTHDAARALAFVTRYSDSAQVTGHGRSPRFRYASAAIDDFRIETIEYSAAGELTLAPRGEIAVAHLLSGQLEFTSGEQDVRLREGQSYLFQTHSSVRLSWDDVRVGVVRIALDEVEREAGRRSHGPRARLEFTDGRPVSSDAQIYWQAVVRHVNRDVLPNRVAARSSAVHSALGRLLSTTLLETFANTADGADRSGRNDKPSTPASLRRAIAFIERHAGEPIELDEIARAAGVSPRTVQHDFRALWDTTPTEYLRKVRLDRAHHDLRAGDPAHGDTVAAIAERWRCGNLGRFAARYRELYGVLPYETLRS